jgi:hypothetical protein
VPSAGIPVVVGEPRIVGNREYRHVSIDLLNGECDAGVHFVGRVGDDGARGLDSGVL